MKIKFNSSILLIISANVNAATTCFTGTLGFVEVDIGLTTYSGFTIGDSFSGCFAIGDSSTDASSIVITPTASDYSFTGAPYGGIITGGSIVGIEDSGTMDDDTVFLNNLYGSNIPYSTLYDGWDTYSFNSAQAFGLTLYSLDTSIISGLDYQILPFTLAQADYAMFYIEETDATGTIYLATGFLTSVAVVPIPSAAWLFGSGLIGLIGIARRKARV